MSTTSAAEQETTRTGGVLRRALVGLGMVVAVIATAIPAASAAESTPIPRPEPCLNIVTCGAEELPPGKVDPGRARPPALPAPTVTFTGRKAYSTPSGWYVRHEFDVSNWESYDPELFARWKNLGVCRELRTRVQLYDADTGRRLRGGQFCAIGTPEGLRDLSFIEPIGHAAPARINVVITDQRTRRTVSSLPVAIPPMSEVTTAYTQAEHANLIFAARHWGIPRDQLQKTGIMALRFIHGIAGTTGSDPLRPRPDVSGPVSYTSVWTTDERHALDWLSQYYDLTFAETHKLGTTLMVFFAALDR